MTLPISDTTRTCNQCGGEFDTATKRIDARYCSRTCQKHSVRTAKRRTHDVEFVAIDGEGIYRGTRHRYVLLGCGERQIEDQRGLGLEAILRFLYDCFLERPDAVYVGFFLGYDFAQWFKQLPMERAWRIFTTAGYALRKRDGGRPPLPVDWKDWQLDALPSMKRVRIRPKGSKQWMHICDAGPFFQSSLLSVIEPSQWSDPVVSESEFAELKTGKERRDSAKLDDEMRYYNRLENNVLSRVMVRYNEGLVKAGVRLTRKQWFGPGQASQEWLKLVGAPKGEEIRNVIPADILDFAIRTYYAGWFEIMCHGVVPGTLWEYDINSAYPFIMANLPCLLHGEWETGSGEPPDRKDTLTMVCARVQGSDKFIGAMLHRSKDGTRLSRPRNTTGHYWLHELEAASNCGMVDNIQFKEWHRFKRGCNCPPPLRGLADLYEQRLAIGKNTPQGKAFKLIYNSAYGKFAQSVGDPIFANPIYASLITAGCRTMILNAIATHPEGTRAVAMVATDGVYFMSRHNHLPLGDGLGQWEESTKENCTLFKPGVYWDDKARQAIKEGSHPKFKARGVSSKDFSRCLTSIDKQFATWDKAWTNSLNAHAKPDDWDDDWPYYLPWQPMLFDWPAVEFTVEFGMTTMAQALQRNDWAQAGLVRHNIKNRQNAYDETKRNVNKVWYHLDTKTWRSQPNDWAGEPESTPYDKRFGEEARNQIWREEITPDGPVSMLWSEAIR